MTDVKDTALQLTQQGFWDVMSVVVLPFLLPVICALIGGYIIMIFIGVYQYKQELKRFYGNDECGE